MKHRGTIELETERLILRQFTEKDIEPSFRNWTNDEKVTEFLRWPTHRDISVTESVLKDLIQKYKYNSFY